MNTAATPMCLCFSRQERDTRCMKLSKRDWTGCAGASAKAAREGREGQCAGAGPCARSAVRLPRGRSRRGAAPELPHQAIPRSIPRIDSRSPQGAEPGWPGAARARPQDCQMLPPQPLRRQAMGRRGGVLHGRSGGRRRLELQFILAGIHGGLVTGGATGPAPGGRGRRAGEEGARSHGR
jgi:hypothetical protein